MFPSSLLELLKTWGHGPIYIPLEGLYTPKPIPSLDIKSSRPIYPTILVIILKYRIRLIEKALIIMARTVLVIIVRIIIIERMLVVLEYKEGSKNRYYRLY